MVYVLTYSKNVPELSSGHINDLLEDWFDNARDAEKKFNAMPLTEEYFRKGMWVKDSSGTRKLLKEEHFRGGRSSSPRN